ncbi:MAG: hypothetical protein QOF52_849 [Propionibacteriaceae bacterium]|nr:hypothetical protein [Propionibacteriaceae bacterium]
MKFAGPVVVVGGGLAGMAAAARLAKAGHSVELVEAADRLGGCWAPYPLDPYQRERFELPPSGALADDAPSILGFPAPFRDLFRKSGRPFDAELQRLGYSLVPASPARHVFPDGATLLLPTDRGEQYAVLRQSYGVGVAERWRSLVDRLDNVWQTVRPLGLEAELRGRSQLDSRVRRTLQPRRSIEQLAREVDHPHLAAIIRSVAYRLGSTPRRTPAWCAVELSVARTFGRWTINGPDVGRSSVLVDALAGRLAQRRVRVRLGARVNGVVVEDGRATGVLVGSERIDAAAVVCTVDPWQLYDALVPPTTARAERRAVHRLHPALAPRVSHRVLPQQCAEVTETVHHRFPGRDAGGPRVEYARPYGAGTLLSSHDYAAATPTASAGAAWDGFASWLRRPPISSEVTGLFVAGSFSRGGSQPSQTVLSGALASYGAHDYLNQALRL